MKDLKRFTIIYAVATIFWLLVGFPKFSIFYASIAVILLLRFVWRKMDIRIEFAR